MFIDVVPYFGLIATLWMLIGVACVGFLYKGYSHTRQFCSELGAAGSPTEKLSPLVNNYPLGVLFIVFGAYVIHVAEEDVFVALSGCGIIAHGIGTWMAGYFPMDLDPYTESPSLSGQLHTWAGVVMLISLIISPVLVVFSQLSFLAKLFSVACIIVSVTFLIPLSSAFQHRTNPGLYQRMSYGTQLIWLSGYTFFI